MARSCARHWRSRLLQLMPDHLWNPENFEHVEMSTNYRVLQILTNINLNTRIFTGMLRNKINIIYTVYSTFYICTVVCFDILHTYPVCFRCTQNGGWWHCVACRRVCGLFSFRVELHVIRRLGRRRCWRRGSAGAGGSGQLHLTDALQLLCFSVFLSSSFCVL